MVLRPPDLFQIQWTYRWGLEWAVNTLHMVRQHSTGNTTDDQDACEKIATKAHDSSATHLATIKANFAKGTSLTQVAVYKLPSPTGVATNRSLKLFDPDPLTGGGSDCLPTEVAMCITLRANAADYLDQHPRSARGRLYMGPLSLGNMANAANAPGRFSPEALTNVLTAWKAILNDLQGVGLGGDGTGAITGSDDYGRVVILDSVRGKWRQVTRLEIGDVPDSQRRRRNRLVEDRSHKDTISVAEPLNGPRP